MIVMPGNSSGWFWHSLARETGKLGHLYSPGAQRGPWPWFPYALDNGAFSAWDQEANTWDRAKWSEAAWRRLIFWAQAAPIQPMWAIIPDVPGDAGRTIDAWREYAPTVHGIPRAIAVQDGMEPHHLVGTEMGELLPDVVCIGGTTEWKWANVALFARTFKRVHVLRCNAPGKLRDLELMGVESCDGTGWNRGNRKQTAGVEEWARENPKTPSTAPLWPHVCRSPKVPEQGSFA